MIVKIIISFLKNQQFLIFRFHLLYDEMIFHLCRGDYQIFNINVQTKFYPNQKKKEKKRT